MHRGLPCSGLSSSKLVACGPPGTSGSTFSSFGTSPPTSGPARTMAPELNDGEGANSLGWEADLGSGEALRPDEGSGGGGGTRCTGKVSFYSRALRGGKAEGGWDARDGSTLAASARPRNASSACMRGHRRRSERLLRRTHVEATRAWHCPLAAEGGEVDRAPEPRLAT
jgi:hypothetical protein